MPVRVWGIFYSFFFGVGVCTLHFAVAVALAVALALAGTAYLLPLVSSALRAPP